jgi:hypothetical protein
VAAPLFTADARELRLLGPPYWQRRLLGWALPVAAAVLIGLHANAAPDPVCTPQDPCRPDALGSVMIGLLFAAAVAGFILPGLAAPLGAGFMITLILAERVLHTEPASPVWLYLVDAGFVGLCVLVAAVSRDRRPTDRALHWLVAVRRERPPPVHDLPRPGRRERFVAQILLVVALACLAWSWFSQRDADAQQQAASRTVAEVVAHPDDGTVQVRLGAETTEVNVLDPDNYPVGSRMDLYVDDRGLRQPVAEPYDATGWVLLAVWLGAMAAQFWIRGVEAGRWPRRLFEEEQPMTEVVVLTGRSSVMVFAGDVRPGEPPVAEIQTLPVPLARGDFRPATLYGVPAPDHWCTVVVEGVVIPPTRPLAARFVLALPYVPDEDEHVPALPLRPEDAAALRPTDREAPPDQVRFHAYDHGAGYAVAAAAPLALLVPLARLFELPYAAALAVAGVVLGVCCAAAWMLVMRGRIAWNGRGVAVVGTTGERRAAWSEVLHIEHDRSRVTLYTAEHRLTVNAGPLFGLVGRGGRSAEELANALRHARSTAVPGADDGPPRLERPRPPLGLYAVWLLGTPLLAWLLEVSSNL